MALDFPASPVDGQVYDNFYYDADKGTWKSLSSGASPNYLVNPTITDAVITATATTSSTVPITVNGAASQTANLQEWKNSAGITLTNIDDSGNIVINGLGSTSENRNITVNSPGYAALILNGDNANTSGEPGGSYINLGRDSQSNSVVLASVNLGQENDVSVGGFTGTAGNSGVLGTVYSSPLYLGTNSIARVAIDSAGRVTMPYQPAFKAYGLNSTPSNSYCVFPTITLNIGSCYSSSTGRFTAPTSGTYVFYYSQIGGNQDTVYRYFLHKNNAALTPDYQLRLDASATGADYGDSGSHAAIIYLNANDYVSIFYQSDNLVASYGSGAPTNSYPTFSGYLIG
jgi:hypothetical protein